MIENLPHIPGFHDPAAVHHRHPVAHFGDHAKVVGDENQRQVRLPLQIFQQFQVLGLDGNIQGSGGFVGNQHRRLAGNADSAHDPLPHSATQLMGIILNPGFGGGNVDLTQHIQGLLQDAALGDGLVDADGFGNLAANGKDRVQRGHRILDNQGDAAAAHFAHLMLGKLEQVLAFQSDAAADDFPGRRRHQAHQGKHRNRLSAARLADDAQSLAPAQLETDPVHRLDRTPTGAEVSAKVGNRQHYPLIPVKGRRIRHQALPGMLTRDCACNVYTGGSFVNADGSRQIDSGPPLC